MVRNGIGESGGKGFSVNGDDQLLHVLNVHENNVAMRMFFSQQHFSFARSH